MTLRCDLLTRTALGILLLWGRPGHRRWAEINVVRKTLTEAREFRAFERIQYTIWMGNRSFNRNVQMPTDRNN
ncbi:protein of unknown function [Hyphomicrobium sp. 1Nfss2.1]